MQLFFCYLAMWIYIFEAEKRCAIVFITRCNVHRNLGMSLVKRPLTSSLLQASGDRQQVSALYEWLQAQQWFLLSVQLLRLLQPFPPGGGLMDPVGTNRQWVGRGAQEEGEAAEGENSKPCWYEVACGAFQGGQEIIILKFNVWHNYINLRIKLPSVNASWQVQVDTPHLPQYKITDYN